MYIYFPFVRRMWDDKMRHGFPYVVDSGGLHFLSLRIRQRRPLRGVERILMYDGDDNVYVRVCLSVRSPYIFFCFVWGFTERGSGTSLLSG